MPKIELCYIHGHMAADLKLGKINILYLVELATLSQCVGVLFVWEVFYEC